MTTCKSRRNDWFIKLSMYAKIREWKSWWETSHLHSLKGFYHKLHLNYKGEKLTLYWRTLVSTNNQVTKINITNTGVNWHVSSDLMHWEEHNITSVELLPSLHHQNLIIRKDQTNPKWGTPWKLTSLNSYKYQGEEGQCWGNWQNFYGLGNCALLTSIF